jgi:very-short-patch-repair endonuclease
VEAIQDEQALVASPPSSDPAGHLLPAGEKRELAAIPNSTSTDSKEEAALPKTEATSFLFSPAGRRWPEGSDEGGEATSQRTSAVKRRPGKTKQARDLRQNEQEAEHRLWGHLRNRLLNGHKFTRQMPLGPYIADFLCREKMLIIELDGSQHATLQSDVARTHWLNDQGYSVLRFWNHEVLQECRAVLDTILAVLNAEITSQCDFIRFSPSLIGKTNKHTE